MKQFTNQIKDSVQFAAVLAAAALVIAVAITYGKNPLKDVDDGPRPGWNVKARGASVDYVIRAMGSDPAKNADPLFSENR